MVNTGVEGQLSIYFEGLEIAIGDAANLRFEVWSLRFKILINALGLRAIF